MEKKPNQLIFGSKAIKHWFPNYKFEPKDLDLITKDESKEKGVEKYWNPAFDYILAHNKDPEYVDPDFLLTIKASHSNWDVKWDKTMSHILFLKKNGCVIVKELYDLLKKDWKQIHGRENAPLRNKSSKEFFDDAVPRKYDHDNIHRAVAYYDEPLFFRILKTENSVDCSKEKFDNLSHDDKIRLAKEEIFVTALERFLIPKEFDFNKRRAYTWSLKKFVTTMSTGWMSFFLIDNFEELLYDEKVDGNYVEKFKQNIKKYE